MSKVKIKIGNDVREIDAAPITLIYKDPKITQDLEYEGRVKLSPELCHEHLHSIEELHPLTEHYVRIVFPDYDKSWDLGWVRGNEGSGFKHVVGRVDFTLHAQDKSVPLVWTYPEASLHPATQANLADLLIELTSRSVDPTKVPEKPRKIERPPVWP